MERALKLPIGIDSFEKIRREGFFYIDKTGLIEQLLNNWGEVNLFTRPRRFGKTLNMSMLKSFFEIGADRSLFEDLSILKNEKLCNEYMGRFPVIFLTLKNAEGLSFETAKYQLTEQIGKEAARFDFLSDSDRLSEADKRAYEAVRAYEDGRYTMEDNTMYASVQTLSDLLYKHYGQKTVILIDEYDVPLDKAFQNGYYNEMVYLMRSLFGKALKANDSLYFAVLTGCLRVWKESIFTGLNNFKVLSITDVRFDEQFGFTEDEVKELLSFYGLDLHLDEIREWYDGYRFGDTDIYCPWDVINHIDRLLAEPDAEPQSYWINTSGNALVKRFIDKADRTTQDELERLVSGEIIAKTVNLELTYDEIDKSIDNLWSVLFTTGYLTQAGKPERGSLRLKIPNEEIREVYKLQIQEWFKNKVLSDTSRLKLLWSAIERGAAEDTERYLTEMLGATISVRDAGAPHAEKENSYHMFLNGLLTGNAEWAVRSNIESGDGYADIIVKLPEPDAGIIFELKSVRDAKELDTACTEALQQIRDKRYAEYLKDDGRDNILLYGIAFYKKRCRVMVQKLS